ncbi:MAG: endoribonuclease YicC domain-containing protein, partial [Schleiferiaceae bacterium]
AVKAADDQPMDPQRWEQELLFYVEKIDINEEKVRLKAHIQHFREALAAGEGRKLGFLAQELGREINTLGNKAHHIGMQREVVQMKEELEKIKEQVLNVL